MIALLWPHQQQEVPDSTRESQKGMIGFVLDK